MKQQEQILLVVVIVIVIVLLIWALNTSSCSADSHTHHEVFSGRNKVKSGLKTKSEINRDDENRSAYEAQLHYMDRMKSEQFRLKNSQRR